MKILYTVSTSRNIYFLLHVAADIKSLLHSLKHAKRTKISTAGEEDIVPVDDSQPPQRGL